MTEWISSPALKAVAIQHATGASVVSGVIDLRFLRAGRVMADTDAHINDDKPAVDFRGESFLVSIFAVRTEDGSWIADPDRDSHSVKVTRRQNWSPAPPTFERAIVSAVLATIAAHWTPELGRAGEHAYAAQQLHGRERDREKAAQALAEIDATLATWRLVYLDTNPTD